MSVRARWSSRTSWPVSEGEGPVEGEGAVEGVDSFSADDSDEVAGGYGVAGVFYLVDEDGVCGGGDSDGGGCPGVGCSGVGEGAVDGADFYGAPDVDVRLGLFLGCGPGGGVAGSCYESEGEGEEDQGPKDGECQGSSGGACVFGAGHGSLSH